jgi:hypothetical protein
MILNIKEYSKDSGSYLQNQRIMNQKRKKLGQIQKLARKIYAGFLGRKKLEVNRNLLYYKL